MNGILLIDKPQSLTSHDVVGRIRKTLDMKAVGHAGTLDPMATGLLIVLLGEATKLSDYLRDKEKSYSLRVKLGLTTNTFDCTGEQLSEQSVDHLTEGDVVDEAQKLQGEFIWEIPIFSAAKVQGKPLYKYAFKGEEVDLPSKQMSFYDLENESYREGQLAAKISCKTGGFIRSWAHKLGENLKVGGALSMLRRESIGEYLIADAVNLSDLEELSHQDGFTLNQLNSFIPINQLLLKWEAFTIRGKDLKLLVNGQVSYDLRRRMNDNQRQCYSSGKPVSVRILSPSGELVSIVEILKGKGPRIKRSFLSHEKLNKSSRIKN